ncbi:hypothetical protein [Prosthecobacter sp.]|uniref:hypothetical protein n=1 Tax=Prosthecobacter sp. TaxID=1965333 RepID=UPI002ABA8D07|nr:hypothetical protein [Prosthecobacter sp.]MDZ4402164.1 hypothetical protein [Prosthecobacter sp.]
MDTVFLGLANLELDCDEIDLGCGFYLRKTYAHLMSHGMVAFAPAPPKGHHPAPWKATQSGYAYDIMAELVMPTKIRDLRFTQEDLSQIMVGLLRLSVKPDIVAPLISTHDLSEAKQDDNAVFHALEALPRFFPLAIAGKEKVTADDLGWLSHELSTTLAFLHKNPKLKTALEVLSDVQFVMHRGMAMISIWAALESLFNIQHELTFKVSAYVAAFLKPAGVARHELFAECKKLYGARSGAAHANAHAEPDDLLRSVMILREVLVKLIESRKVPDAKSLELMLFGDNSQLKEGNAGK